MTSVLALDLSSTRTGACLDGHVQTFTPSPKLPLLDRARALRNAIGDCVGEHRPDLIVIEAIGTRMINTAIALATVHALVIDRIDRTPILMVAPADLKKFATGKGNAPKDVVMLAAAKLEPAIANNDEADAWWLWCIGVSLTDGDCGPVPAYRQAVIAKLKANHA